MSNPAVLKLASGKVGTSKVWLDDNFGESIHLHIDDMRVDMNVSEFSVLYDDLCDILNDLSGIENIDFKTIDPVFLSVMLWQKLPDLVAAHMDTVRLSDMLAPYHNKVFKLEDSVGVRALKDNVVSEEYRKSGHILQSENERMLEILESVKTNGYPYMNHYIVMYGDDNIIRDGQHRASCLFFLYGDIEVPVLRLYFKDYKSPRIHRFYNTMLFSFLRLCRAKLSSSIVYQKLKKRIIKVFKKGKTS